MKTTTTNRKTDGRTGDSPAHLPAPDSFDDEIEVAVVCRIVHGRIGAFDLEGRGFEEDVVDCDGLGWSVRGCRGGCEWGWGR
jgi:hypothetical protein